MPPRWAVHPLAAVAHEAMKQCFAGALDDFTSGRFAHRFQEAPAVGSRIGAFIEALIAAGAPTSCAELVARQTKASAHSRTPRAEPDPIGTKDACAARGRGGGRDGLSLFATGYMIEAGDGVRRRAARLMTPGQVES